MLHFAYDGDLQPEKSILRFVHTLEEFSAQLLPFGATKILPQRWWDTGVNKEKFLLILNKMGKLWRLDSGTPGQ